MLLRIFLALVVLFKDLSVLIAELLLFNLVSIPCAGVLWGKTRTSGISSEIFRAYVPSAESYIFFSTIKVVGM